MSVTLNLIPSNGGDSDLINLSKSVGPVGARGGGGGGAGAAGHQAEPMT